MTSAKISLNDYSALCLHADISPNYHPSFIEYYFGVLKKKPQLIGKYDKQGQLIAAYPVYLRQVFPNTLHMRLLGDRGKRMGCIGQPEILFPVAPEVSMISLNYLAPTTSPLLNGIIRQVPKYSLKSMAIAQVRRHKKLTHRVKVYFETEGKAYFTDSLDKKDFAETYIRLHCERWGFSIYDFRYVKEQILHLYDNIFGVILCNNGEPVASQLCFTAAGKTIYYVDFINSGVKIEKNNNISYGSILMLLSLRRAEETALKMGKKLRYSFGYYYGDRTYKAIWARPEMTFIGL